MSGWLASFKIRHTIAFKSVSGESGAVDTVVVNNWKERITQLCSDYQLKNIINADETGLCFRALPNKTLATRGE